MRRQTKSIEAHKQDGTYNSTKHGVDVPLAEGPLRKINWDKMSSEDIYTTIADVIAQKGLDHAEYSLALELLVYAVNRMLKLRRDLKSQGGETYITPTGIRKNNPTAKLVMEAEKQVDTLLQRFGLTPDSRSRVARKKGELNLGGEDSFGSPEGFFN